MCRVHCDLRTKLWPSGSPALQYLILAVLGKLALDDTPLIYMIYVIYKSPLYCRPYMLAMSWSMSRDTVKILCSVGFFRLRFRQRPNRQPSMGIHFLHALL